MKIAIVGSSGYIASYLIYRFENEQKMDSILRIGRSNSDQQLELLRSEEFDYSVLDDIEYVIFTAAISSPDQCANDFHTCWKINVEGSTRFIREALSRNCKVLFFSSDAVFGNDHGSAFYEDSPTRAATAYGRMKKTVEDEFKDEHGFKAIRLSYVISSHDKFIRYCLDCMRNNSEAEIFHPFYRNCITLSEVGNIIAWMIKRWEDYPYCYLNAAGPELISRIRIVDELNRKTGNALRYKVTIPDEAFFRNRPEITQMESLYLEKYGILQAKSFAERFQAELKGVII